MLERSERALSDTERHMLRARLTQVEQRRRTILMKSGAASAIVCAVLALLTLLASDAPAVVVCAFWGVLAIVLMLWTGMPERRALDTQRALLVAAVPASRARVTRIQASRVVEFEEIEDEGACFAFEVESDQVVFIHGQEFYASERFPNSDFSFIEIVGQDGVVVDEIMHVDGMRLVTERRLDRATKDRLELPGHLEVVAASLDDLEQALPRRVA
jgi:hypothetical protein